MGKPSAQPGEAFTFLQELAANKPEDAWMYLWSMGASDPSRLDKAGKPTREKRTHWSQDIQEMAKLAVELDSQGSDVYVGCSFAKERGSPHERIKAENAYGIWGSLLDIDYQAPPPAHKKANLPPN